MTSAHTLFWATVLAALGGVNLALAQNYPSRAIRVVLTSPGGGSDFAVRLLSTGLSSALGQQIIVDNRGGNVVPIEIVARAQPDGYTLLYYGSAMWQLPLMQKVSYDVLRDLAPVSLLVNSPIVAAVHPSVPARSIKDVIALARAKPGSLNYSAAGAGSASHLAMELFKFLGRLDMVHVPFKSSGPAMTALVAGEIHMSMSSSAGVLPHVNSGRVRALAVTSLKRSKSLPDLPTVAEAGMPGYEFAQVAGLFAPGGTPAAIIERLNKEAVSLVNRADIRDKLFSAGAEPEGTTPRDATARIKAEMTRLGKVIRDANIRME